MRSTGRLLLGLVLVALMTVLAGAVGTPPDSTADVVYGQLGSFTTATFNAGGENGKPTRESLLSPGGVALDRDGNLYVADTSNNRVLFFPAGSTVATRVYGQNGSFTTNVSNFGSGPGQPTTAGGLSSPEGVALDSQGNLYVADRGGNRVLFFPAADPTDPAYPAASTTATRSYGQGSLTSNSANRGQLVPAADSLSGPFSVALDQNDNLYIADAGNNRVVFYPREGDVTTRMRVYGQPDFTSNAVVATPTANTLNAPWGVAVDHDGNLYVADRNNSRVLFYLAGSTTATRVYGQAGVFTTRNAGRASDQLAAPEGVALDRYGNLFVVDRGNNRVLFFHAGSTTATQVYGQAGFSANDGGPNRGGTPSAVTLSAPKSVGLDRMGNLYVADRSNHRVLEFYRVPDTSAPTAAPAPSIAANPFGWNNTDVTVSWNWADEEGGTGIDDASCEVSTTSSGEGAALTLSSTCPDLAGNTATASYSLNIDRTRPAASAGQSPSTNVAGWNNTDVTVAWNWSDGAGGAGIDAANCTTSTTSSDQGDPIFSSATCSDLAGNTAEEFYSVRIDKTPPVSVPAQAPPANVAGWNNSDVTVTWNWSDALSGLSAGACTSSSLSSGEGNAVNVSASCADVAGNNGSSSFSVKVDKTAPSVSLVGGPANGQTYSLGSVPAAPACSAADALSGLAGPCATSGYSAAIGIHTVSASVADNAGNQNSVAVTYSVAAPGWTLSGFYAPVDMGDVWNALKAGATVPLKFEVFAGTTELTDTSIVKQLQAGETACAPGVTDDIELLAPGATVLRYDTAEGQFIYNWQTPKKPGSCYLVSVTTTDGSTLSGKFRLK